MFTLHEKTRENIRKRIGLTTGQIEEMSWEQLDAFIEKKTGKKIQLAPPRKSCLSGRGSVYISLGRLIPESAVDKKLARIK